MMHADQLRRVARRIVAVISEMNEAQRRMTVLRMAPDRYLTRPDEMPHTYAEFLARTSGPLLREASASARARRQRGCRQ